VHGSAPKLVGRARANPLATLLCVSLLLDDLGMPAAALELERAIQGAIEAGETTPDLGGTLRTTQATDAVLTRLTPA